MTPGDSPTPEPAPEQGSLAEELEYRLRQQRLTSEYALFALGSRDSQSLLEEAARVCAEGMQSEFCKVMEHLPDEDRFLVRAGIGWGPGVVGVARTGADMASPTGYAFASGEAVISNHETESGSRFRTPQLLKDYGVKRAINAPIRCGGDRFGVIEVDSPNPGRFTAADLFFVTGFANLLGVALERQRVEEELVRKEALLEEALEFQEVLAREISHRVKNSLAIVGGLLRMQTRTSSDPDLKQALADAEARVHAIAKVHDRLWRKDEVHGVDLAEFLEELVEDLRTAAPNHEIVCDLASAVVTPDHAISLGLLTNELVTNAVKYAYPEGAGRIEITVKTQENGEIRMEVRDFGVGVGADAVAQQTGLGRRVISVLSRHLSGKPEWQDADPGLRFVLTFRPQAPR